MEKQRTGKEINRIWGGGQETQWDCWKLSEKAGCQGGKQILWVEDIGRKLLPKMERLKVLGLRMGLEAFCM